MHKLLDGLISKIIPCVLYPIATILLVQGIRKAGRQRKEMVSPSSTANSKDASKLVLATTLTFFFAELPLGIIYMLDPFAGFKMKGFDMQVVLSTLFQLFSNILTVTTATHMIICLLISTEYRKTCLVIIRCGYVPKTKKQTQFVALNTKT
ncbi:hypothetical protein L5515_006777 [Caenorhabditis briggsae]|uniref:G-protein coupled receptors family 1 profile domain-containing protein n=1 Tax=Caenorhabditis briggsae TaxID=6238 RepID=A0AAE9EWS8_CAEBR|nr:hypothetical protein L5515_006777 [Caenorhabditis briggsae]